MGIDFSAGTRLGVAVASVRVGTTTTGAPGTAARVTNSGDTLDAVLNFEIPRGDAGGVTGLRFGDAQIGHDRAGVITVGAEVLRRQIMTLVDELTVPVSNTGAVARVERCVAWPPLGVVARCVATGGVGGTPSAPSPIGGHLEITLTHYAASEQEQPQTYRVTLPETVYGIEGAEVRLYLDKGYGEVFETGVILNGSEVWHNYMTQDFTDTYVKFAGIGLTAGISYARPSRCSHLTRGSVTTGTYTPNQFTAHSNGNLYVGVEIPGVSDIATWKAYLAAHPMILCYAVATPKIITFDKLLIPALAGVNSMHSDGGGDTTVTGRMGVAGVWDVVQQLRQAQAGV